MFDLEESDEDAEVEVDVEGKVVDVVGVVLSSGADDLSSLGGVEDHSQPIVILCKWSVSQGRYSRFK